MLKPSIVVVKENGTPPLKDAVWKLWFRLFGHAVNSQAFGLSFLLGGG